MAGLSGVISIHWCMFDKKCRGLGAPARIYVRWRQHQTIYFNPADWRDRGYIDRRAR